MIQTFGIYRHLLASSTIWHIEYLKYIFEVYFWICCVCVEQVVKQISVMIMTADGL